MTETRRGRRPQDDEVFVTSAGVEVRLKPFPPGLYNRLQARALREHPDPVPPKREIQTVSGPEWVDDEEAPAYKEALEAARKARTETLGQAILDFCAEVDLGRHGPALKKLARYTDLPEDPDELRVAFLEAYALQTKQDWEAVMTLVMSRAMVSDPEVAERLRSFRRALEGPATADADASGAAEVERLAVQPEVPGA